MEDQCKKYFRCKNGHCGYSLAYCLIDGILLVLFSLTFGSTLWLVGFANFTFLLVMYFSFDCYIYSFSESFLAFWCSFFPWYFACSILKNFNVIVASLQGLTRVDWLVWNLSLSCLGLLPNVQHFLKSWFDVLHIWVKLVDWWVLFYGAGHVYYGTLNHLHFFFLRLLDFYRKKKGSFICYGQSGVQA